MYTVETAPAPPRHASYSDIDAWYSASGDLDVTSSLSGSSITWIIHEHATVTSLLETSFDLSMTCGKEEMPYRSLTHGSFYSDLAEHLH